MAKPTWFPGTVLGLGALAATPMGCGLSDRYFIDDSLGRGGWTYTAATGGTSIGGTSQSGAESLGGSQERDSRGGLGGVNDSSGGTSSDPASAGSSGTATNGGNSSSGNSSGGELGQSGAETSAGGAPEEGGTGPDLAGAGGEAAVGCVLGAFGAPEPVEGLAVSDYDEWGPALSGDGALLYFTVWDGDVTRIYTAARPNRDASFSGAKQLPALTPSDALPCPSGDGLTLYFVSTRSGGTDKDIWFATRASADASFANPMQLAAVNSNKHDQRPWVSADGLTLMFVSDRPGGSGTLDIWWSKRSSPSGTFSTPVNLPGINSSSQDESPVLTADGLTLYFASNRAGSKELYTATRTDLESDFGDPSLVPGVNSDDDEVDVALSADDRELFFATNRNGTSQIWRTTRSCL